MSKVIEIKVEVSPDVKAWNPEKEHFYDQSLLPIYSHPGDAGFDFRANLDHREILKPGKRILIPTGVRVSLPQGYELQVRPRSGLALKYGISIVNTPGTVDSGFEGEIGVILINFGEEDFIINPGDRIAQGVISEFVTANFIPVPKIERNSIRGEGGYGSSGVK